MGLIYLKNVATLRIDQDKCVGGCNYCVEVCPHGVLAIVGNKATIINLDLCIECGACALNCPFNAISVRTGAGCAKALIKGMAGRKEAGCSKSPAPEAPSCCKE